MNSNFVTEILCSVSFLVYLTAAASCSFEQSHRVSHRRAAISQSEHGGGIRLRGGEDGKSETIVVPTDCKGVAEAVKLACGQLKRYVTMPSEMEREAGKILDPDINNYGEAVLPETYEWTPASGQKIRALIIRSHLDFRGEDGVCCMWSALLVEALRLMQHMPGVGGGLTLNIGDECESDLCVRVFPGPLTGVLAASGNSRVSLLDCILLPVELTNIGTHGYGMFAWGQSVVKFVGCEVQDFQVGADVSFNASVVFESCDVSHNRFAIYLHDEAHVSMSNCTLTQNHKSAFCVGHHGKDRASLALRNVSLLGNKLWSDDDRPKTLVEENVVIDLENFSLPVVYRDTNFTIAHVDQTFDEESEAERAFLHEYMTNCSRTAMEMKMKMKMKMTMVVVMMMTTTTMPARLSSSSSSSLLEDPTRSFLQPPSTSAANCLYDPGHQGSDSHHLAVSAAACPCPSSSDISASFKLSSDTAEVGWNTNKEASVGDRVLIAINFEGRGRDDVYMLQLQLRRALDVLVMKEYLTSPETFSSHARCLSFTYEHALPGAHLVSVMLFSSDKSESKPELLFSSHHNFQVKTDARVSPPHNLSTGSPASLLLNTVKLNGQEVEIPLYLCGVLRGTCLVLVAVTETETLEVSNKVLLLDLDCKQGPFNVSLAIPSGKEYSLFVALTELKDDLPASLKPALQLRKFFNFNRCVMNECSLADHMSPPSSELHTPALPPTPAANSVAPHPEDLLCSIHLSFFPGETVHALETFTVQVNMAGLAKGSRYKIVLFITLKETGLVMFEKTEVFHGDALQFIKHDISSFWPGEFVVHAMLFDDHSQIEGEDTILAKLTRKIVSVASCQVSYLWSSSGSPLFNGSLPYKDAPFSAPAASSTSLSDKELPVTLVTVATVDRAVVLVNVAAHWKEDMAVAFYARSQSDEQQIRRFVRDSLGPWFSSRGRQLEIVMLTLCPDADAEARFAVFPINMLRKISCAIAKSDLVLYSDVDMIPSDSLAHQIRLLYQTSTVTSQQLLVVPSFKSNGAWPPYAHVELHNKSLLVRTHAVTFLDLVTSFDACQVNIPAMPCGLWSPSHRWTEAGVYHAPTEYSRWFNTSVAYEVDYITGYEPYVVVNRSSWMGRHGAGMYDDGYISWGWDKSSLTLEAALLGYSFLVLPMGFLVHASSQIKQRQLNVRLFAMGQQMYPGWGPPDTRGRQRFHAMLFSNQVDPQPNVAIRSYLVPAFKADGCSMAGLRLVPADRVEVSKEGHVLRVTAQGLCEGVGYQIYVSVLQASDRMPLHKLFSQHTLLPRQFAGSSHETQLKLGRLPAGKVVLKLELQDLQASKVLERSGRATIDWTERKYEIGKLDAS
ncbi:hypothetical protein GUITHDRAFT_121643 [Guillardia theta CCMP2712]|uniref:Right handed beta helix domain-containing protein n=1 Tax=Guillardia theta (strain CCMP2712) TaxID=905079 RepID=L1I7F5_GUITC|nr:hypothetical protein GUITHDRAFT_121643 [Guillardia theta CCMP2712]EKX32183.1 hypothetical protein GUITHDRAFT_121643 [Guillardia theta CCMP2712]|eukprot:XP_005819163.1 hypothetical protein GUITHDRAFT_121643 [Guillardia theta CCMP2712]